MDVLHSDGSEETQINAIETVVSRQEKPTPRLVETDVFDRVYEIIGVSGQAAALDDYSKTMLFVQLYLDVSMTRDMITKEKIDNTLKNLKILV
jgi:hypothetical protein